MSERKEHFIGMPQAAVICSTSSRRPRRRSPDGCPPPGRPTFTGSLICYRDEAEAIAIANESMYGLGGSVFAPDVEHGLEVAAKIITGTCSVKGGPPSGGGGPFGGRKQSGLGYERAVEGLESFLQLKSVALPVGYELRGE